MDAEDKRKLDRVLKLAEENNAYIRKVRRTQKTTQMWKAIYWVVIIVFMLGGFYYVKPYLGTLASLYSGMNATGTSDSSFQLSEVKQLQKILNQFKQQEQAQ